MFIIAAITKFLLARKVSSSAAGPLAWAIALVGAALLAFGGWQLVKRSIIRQHDAEQRAEAAEEQLDRVFTADSVDDALENRDEADDDAVEGAIDDAVDQDPNEGRTATGPVTNAALDELRRQRARQ